MDESIPLSGCETAKGRRFLGQRSGGYLFRVIHLGGQKDIARLGRSKFFFPCLRLQTYPLYEYGDLFSK